MGCGGSDILEGGDDVKVEFSADQLAEALKGALEEGVRFAAESAAAEGGFSGNQAIKIPVRTVRHTHGL